jgi:hypothetical protein
MSNHLLLATSLPAPRLRSDVRSLPGLRAGFAPLFEKRVAMRRLSTFLAPFSEKGRSGRGA